MRGAVFLNEAETRQRSTGKTVMIAFEGIDGSGKGSQLELVCRWLQNSGFRVKTLDFPVYDSFFGREIGLLLSGRQKQSAARLDPKSMSLWYAMDRYEAFRKNDFTEYDVILLNRSTLSNAIYQSARCGSPQEEAALRSWIQELEYRRLAIPVPDLFVIFDVPVANSRENVGKKGHRDYVGEDADVYEKDLSLLEKVRAGYLEAADQMEHVLLIPCVDSAETMRPREEILADVVRGILPLL